MRDERNVTRVQVPSASCLLHWVSYPPTLGAWRGSAMRPECPELRGCYLAAAQLEQLKAGRDVAETELRWHMSRRHRLFRAMPGPWSPCPASGHTNLPHSGLNGTESATGLNHVEGRKTRPPRRAAQKEDTHRLENLFHLEGIHRWPTTTRRVRLQRRRSTPRRHRHPRLSPPPRPPPPDCRRVPTPTHHLVSSTIHQNIRAINSRRREG